MNKEAESDTTFSERGAGELHPNPLFPKIPVLRPLRVPPRLAGTTPLTKRGGTALGLCALRYHETSRWARSGCESPTPSVESHGALKPDLPVVGTMSPKGCPRGRNAYVQRGPSWTKR